MTPKPTDTLTDSTTQPTITAEDIAAGRRAAELDVAHVFHSWSVQGTAGMTILKAQGSELWDGEGKRYLDFSSQLVNANIGHQHPRVVEAIQKQAAELCTIAPSYVNPARSEAARLIVEKTPGDLNHVFFTNGGADAVEHAIRMARLHTGRHKVLSAYHSYHGGTQLAVNVTGDPRRIPNDNGSTGTVHFFTPYLYRSPFHAQNEAEETERALHHLEQVMVLEGVANIAALILETVPGTAGIMVPSVEYMQGVRELTRKYGVMFIADEVMAGFGRTGTWFAIEHFGIEPDLITFAKGVNSGYVPLGGVIMSDAIYTTFTKRSYPGGLTYSGHPLACAAAVATIGAMEDEGMVENAADLGARVIGPALEQLRDKHPCVGEVRGLGMFWAIELVRDRDTREPLVPYGGSDPIMNEVLANCRENGLIPFANFTRIHVVPPLNTTEAQLREGIAIIDAALDIADQRIAAARGDDAARAESAT